MLHHMKCMDKTFWKGKVKLQKLQNEFLQSLQELQHTLTKLYKVYYKTIYRCRFVILTKVAKFYNWFFDLILWFLKRGVGWLKKIVFRKSCFWIFIFLFAIQKVAFEEQKI